VIYATGIIASGKSTYDTTGGQVAGSETLVEYLRKARATARSRHRAARRQPRRLALASDVIWREVL
jgi:hypothetical protein